jgi:hypothetical protein
VYVGRPVQQQHVPRHLLRAERDRKLCHLQWHGGVQRLHGQLRPGGVQV